MWNPFPDEFCILLHLSKKHIEICANLEPTSPLKHSFLCHPAGCTCLFKQRTNGETGMPDIGQASYGSDFFFLDSRLPRKSSAALKPECSRISYDIGICDRGALNRKEAKLIMCGIVGYTHFSTLLPRDVVSAAMKSISHRGPDHAGYFQSSQISLAAVRLRILDLYGGDQPLASPDGNVIVLFNGEIFNHREIRSELVSDGYSFRSECDTEVILNAFLRWDKGCFSRLRGMFAIAIWIQSERRLLLARDRMGIKPLYYCFNDGELYFGSELKCILAHPAVYRRISLPALDCFLSLNYVPAPLTLVQGVTKLMPGQLLEWNSRTSRVEDYRPTASLLPAPASIEAACEELDHLLMESVREQLNCHVPVGIWLSGGLDSSTVLRYVAQMQSTAVQTFSVTFKDDSSDESAYINEVSRYFGTQHFELDLNETSGLCDAIEQITYHSDEPNADAGALPVWFLSRVTREYATVALSGEGADELFAGYLTHKADLYSRILRKSPLLLRKAALACANRLPASDERIGFEYKLKRLLEGSMMTPDLAHVFWNGTFSERQKRDLLFYAASGEISELVSGMKGSGLERFLDFDQRYYLPDNILTKVDRMSMAHSLEVRPPFLDPRIVNFAARLPGHFKLRGSQSKYVLRRLMRNKLPALILKRSKVGFDIPIHRWFRGVLRPLLLETLSQEAVEATDVFRWEAIRSLLDRHDKRKENLGYHLWGLMILFMWMRRWNMTFAPLGFGTNRVYGAS